MNDSNPSPRKSEEDTVTLNLKPFTPGAKVPPPSAPDGDDSITLLIERAACEVAGDASHPVMAPKGPIAPKDMLGAVTYSYAKGVYRSEDIARKMDSDPEFRAAVGENMPDAGLIRRFRRLNRDAILETLAKVFRRQRKKAAKETMAQTLPGATPAAPVSPGHPPKIPESGETTIVSIRDAEEKLNKAAWIDNMSKGE
ncbi:MAG TPA: transposase, partial [Verrucomicrobiae bacterium]|nr:transposase [Verrucomicrobiae bacterium]